MLFPVSHLDLVTDILQQSTSAPPDSKVMRRLYRQGRREAKRAVPVDGVREMLSAAVEEAMATVTGQYLREREQAQAMLHDARAECLRLQAQITDLDTGGRGMPAAADMSPSDLSEALDLLIEQRRSQQRAVAEEALRQADANRNSALQRLPSLWETYRQQCEGCIAAGRVLWRRYCTGYLWAHNRPGATAADIDDSERDFDVRLPATFEINPYGDDSLFAGGGGRPSPSAYPVDWASSQSTGADSLAAAADEMQVLTPHSEVEP